MKLQASAATGLFWPCLPAVQTISGAEYAARRDSVERYNNVGIRIEDDYLITPSGVEWLSRAPREMEEIEAAMRARRGTGTR